MTTKPEMTAADIAKAVAGGKMSALDATEAPSTRLLDSGFTVPSTSTATPWANASRHATDFDLVDQPLERAARNDDAPPET